MPLSLHRAASDAAGLPALRIGERSWTFAELARLAERWRDRDRAGRGSPPSPRLVTAHTSASAVAGALSSLDGGGAPLVPMHPGLPDERRLHLEAMLDGAAIAPDVAAILFTSGSTGEPKGVMLPRRAFVASARASASRIPLAPGDRWLTPLSWSAMGGLSVLVRSLIARSEAELLPGADGASLRHSIDRGATVVSLVPALLGALLDDHQWRPPEHLRAVLVGGAALDPTLHARAGDRGVPVLTTYGMTETCSQIATAIPGEPGPEGAVGALLPGVRVRIEGEQIQVAGPTLMRGYLGGGGIADDGWFATGDTGRLQGRWLQVLGRTDDRISSGGSRVDPHAVESVLRRVDGVVDACVIGLPDPTWQELVAAVVVLAPGLNSDPVVESIRIRAAADLLGPERPRRLRVAKRLPRTATGKIDRRRLKTGGGPWIPLRYQRPEPAGTGVVLNRSSDP